VTHLAAGLELCLLLAERARVHWGTNGWQQPSDIDTEDSGLGHVARLPTQSLNLGTTIEFTFYWPDRAAWHDEEFQVVVHEGSP
jgi:hypothetical protein